MLGYATTQTALAKDALDKLTASGNANSDQVDAAQMKYDLAAAKLDVLKGRMDDAGKSAESVKAGFEGIISAGRQTGTSRTTKSRNR